MKEVDGSDVDNNFLSLFNKENVNSRIKEKENKKINSARVAVSVQQRNLKIISNKTNKYFPSDFFDALDKERNIKTRDNNEKKKIVSNDGVNNTSNYNSVNYINHPIESNPPYFVKNNEFKIIPEVEDNKLNTLYDKNNTITSKEFKNNPNLNKNKLPLSNIFSENNVSKVSLDKVIKRCEKVDEKISYDSFLKENNSKAAIENSITNDNSRIVSSKITFKSINDEQSLNEVSSSHRDDYNGLRFSLKMMGANDMKQTGCFSPDKCIEKKGSINKDLDNTLPEGHNWKEVIKMEKENLRKESSKKSIDSQNVKLPLIKSSRADINCKIDKNEISYILEACKDLNKDPEINEKLNELMNKIVDLKNVINSKSSSRIKISSAPSQDNKKIGNTLFNKIANNIDEITFSKFPQFEKKTLNNKATVGHFSGKTKLFHFDKNCNKNKLIKPSNKKDNKNKGISDKTTTLIDPVNKTNILKKS